MSETNKLIGFCVSCRRPVYKGEEYEEYYHHELGYFIWCKDCAEWGEFWMKEMEETSKEGERR